MGSGEVGVLYRQGANFNWERKCEGDVNSGETN